MDVIVWRRQLLVVHCLTINATPIKITIVATIVRYVTDSIPESEKYLEAIESGGPDESCLFDVNQEKCLPSPLP